MSEQMFKYIKIGGTIRASDLTRFLYAAYDDGVIHDQKLIDDTTLLKYKLEAIDNSMRGDWLWLEATSFDDDNFPNIEQLCDELNLSYDRHVVSEWNYTGTVVQQRPGQQPLVQLESSATSEYLSDAEASDVLNMLENGETTDAMAKLEGAINRSLPLPPFTII